MPELPEVETMVRGVRPRLEGATIVGATLTHTDVLRGVSRPRLVAALTGAFVDRVTRRMGIRTWCWPPASGAGSCCSRG